LEVGDTGGGEGVKEKGNRNNARWVLTATGRSSTNTNTNTNTNTMQPYLGRRQHGGLVAEKGATLLAHLWKVPLSKDLKPVGVRGWDAIPEPTHTSEVMGEVMEAAEASTTTKCTGRGEEGVPSPSVAGAKRSKARVGPWGTGPPDDGPPPHPAPPPPPQLTRP
jgi:hypothetical protein